MRWYPAGSASMKESSLWVAPLEVDLHEPNYRWVRAIGMAIRHRHLRQLHREHRGNKEKSRHHHRHWSSRQASERLDRPRVLEGAIGMVGRRPWKTKGVQRTSMHPGGSWMLVASRCVGHDQRLRRAGGVGEVGSVVVDADGGDGMRHQCRRLLHRRHQNQDQICQS